MKEIVKYILSYFDDIQISDIRKFISYLKHYGYLNRSTLKDFIVAVKLIQAHAGILQDGIAGPKTFAVMNWPRCSRKENLIEENRTANKWGLSALKYYIESRDNDLPANRWDQIILEIFNHTSSVCGLKFSRTNNKNNSNIVITVGNSRREGLGTQGSVLGFAYLPPSSNYTGQLLLKLDTAENWIEEGSSERGIIMRAVMEHELGHIFGLSHQNQQGRRALMAPYYNPRITKFQNDDISRLQRLYGAPQGPTEPEVPEEPTTPDRPSGERVNIEVVGDIQDVNIRGFRISKLDD